MQKRRRMWLVGIAIAMLCPFPIEVVPAWRFRVVDVAGNPIKNVEVEQFWKHYTFELSDRINVSKRTDEQGFVSFPRRTIFLTPLTAVLVPVVNIPSFTHDRFGRFASVYVRGGENTYGVEDYEPGKPLPEQVVLEKY